jgi:hypothetical protein
MAKYASNAFSVLSYVDDHLAPALFQIEGILKSKSIVLNWPRSSLITLNRWSGIFGSTPLKPVFPVVNKKERLG